MASQDKVQQQKVAAAHVWSDQENVPDVSIKYVSGQSIYALYQKMSSESEDVDTIALTPEMACQIVEILQDKEFVQAAEGKPN